VHRDALLAAGMLVASIVAVLPYLRGGPGFFMDDWRNLARLETVGWLRAAEASRFASRPGAWAVETVLYPVLRDHAFAWTLALAVLNAVAAMAVLVALRRFTSERVALTVALVWVVLPNHTSLRVFPNVAPMVVGLILLAVAVVLIDSRRPVLGGLAVAAGGMCLEVMLLPGLVALVVLHLVRGRGDRRGVLIGIGVILLTGALMLIHPTYSPGGARRGTPVHVLPAHFGSGLTPAAPVAWVLSGVAAAGIAVALVQFARGRRSAGSGPWLVVAGLAVLALGVAAFVLKWPVGPRGQADRNFVVSSFGSAMVWVGIGRLVFERHRAVAVAAAVAFGAVLVHADVRFQQDWARSAGEARAMLLEVECRYSGAPPRNLAVGPWVPVYGDVRALHWFYLRDASRVLTGEPMDFVLAEDEVEWSDRPAELRLRWEELVAQGGCAG
jgi:hypothetical protein